MQSVILPVKRGPVTIVDKDIAEKLMDQKLWLNRLEKGYVRFKRHGRIIYLHRFIIKASKGSIVDHINGNSMDNRRNNLRIVSRRQNNLNRNTPSKSSSGFRFVYLRLKRKRCWRLQYNYEESRSRSCMFFSRFVAALFADDILISLIDPPAYLNFPNRIHRKNLRSFIEMTSGRFFKVVFSRRSDGGQRMMVCRIDGKMNNWSSNETYDPNEHNLIRVFDVKSKGFRLIPLERVLCLHFKRKNYAITP